MKLTEHFSLEEFTESPTAKAKKIQNNPSQEEIENLKRLCETILEPLRKHFGQPIKISSGYRGKELNKAVGGAITSNHVTGCAADIVFPDNESGKKWMSWIIDNCDFDECIWETANKKTYWIHVATRKSGNRHKIVKYLLKK